MTSAVLPRTIRPNHEGRDRGSAAPTEIRIREVHRFLALNEIAMSPSKVVRIVRDYEHKVEGKGIDLLAFVLNNIEMRLERIRTDPEIMRWLTYADPTGETVAREIDRGRTSLGLRREVASG